MGFILDNSQASAAHDGKLQPFSVAASHSTLLAPGDVVRLTGTSSVDGIASVDAVAQGESLTGVIAGIMPQFTGENLTETGIPASTAGLVYCHTDPNLTFDVTASATVSADQVGLNADAVVTAATKLGGLTVSNMELDTATIANTATLQFRIVALIPDVGTGDITGDTVRVRINNSTTTAGTQGV